MRVVCHAAAVESSSVHRMASIGACVDRFMWSFVLLGHTRGGSVKRKSTDDLEQREVKMVRAVDTA